MLFLKDKIKRGCRRCYECATFIRSDGTRQQDLSSASLSCPLGHLYQRHRTYEVVLSADSVSCSSLQCVLG